MAHDPQGFLKYGRVDTPKRPAAERVRDWQPIYLRARDEVVSEQAAGAWTAAWRSAIAAARSAT